VRDNSTEGSGAPSEIAENYWRNLSSNNLTPPQTLTGRFTVLDVWPRVEGGRRPVKAAVGELIMVNCVAFREGHDRLGVDLIASDAQGRSFRSPMVPRDNGTDMWDGNFRPDHEGDWSFSIATYSDILATWRHRAEVKIPAGVDIELELEEGARILARADVPDRTALDKAIRGLRNTALTPAGRLAAGLDESLWKMLREHPIRDLESMCGPWPVFADRRRALFGSWYELFPRSEGASMDPLRSGTFRDAAQRLPEIAQMGFDVVYLPPIHPVGTVNRKGPNNSLTPGPGDPGSPWAIGSADGGHDAVHPDLGTIDDFDAFVASTRELGMEVALDLALQVAPDHPWATSGRPWFTVRADGSIAYAENPPKKYQDIYPMWFDGDPAGLVAEVLRIIRYWMDYGVRIFRVDNPHTKPVRFWDHVLGEIKRTDPDVLFLAEAFTRPPMMRALAEVGFHQSYTYFTWRNEKWELEEYLRELSGPSSAFMRPNFFVNTPDILHSYLQYGGPAAFSIRATLGATMSPTWGVYSGFELFEHVAVRPGSEEYLDSEKYQYRPRDWDKAAAEGKTLAPYLSMLNEIRREHPALQQLRHIVFQQIDSDRMIAFSKRDGDDTIIVVVTLDPFGPREATLHLDMPSLGLDWHDRFVAQDLISGQSFSWSATNFVRLDPHLSCAHIMSIRPGVV
jgi:starch synthase (maltosyl-transferring)